MNSSFVKIPAQLSIIGGQKKRESVFVNKVIFKDNHMPCDVNNNCMHTMGKLQKMVSSFATNQISAIAMN